EAVHERNRVQRVAQPDDELLPEPAGQVGVLVAVPATPRLVLQVGNVQQGGPGRAGHRATTAAIARPTVMSPGNSHAPLPSPPKPAMLGGTHGGRVESREWSPCPGTDVPAVVVIVCRRGTPRRAIVAAHRGQWSTPGAIEAAHSSWSVQAVQMPETATSR